MIKSPTDITLIVIMCCISGRRHRLHATVPSSIAACHSTPVHCMVCYVQQCSTLPRQEKSPGPLPKTCCLDVPHWSYKELFQCTRDQWITPVHTLECTRHVGSFTYCTLVHLNCPGALRAWKSGILCWCVDSSKYSQNILSKNPGHSIQMFACMFL